MFKFPRDICIIITEYSWEWVLLRWVEENICRLDWSELSNNPLAINLLERNRDKIDWSNISGNENALYLIEEKLREKKGESFLDWSRLSENRNAMKILEREEYRSYLDWERLSMNENAVSFLKKEENIGNVNWVSFCMNENEEAMEFLRKNRNKIVWYWLCKNKSAISIIEEEIKDRDWNVVIGGLCQNENASHLIKYWAKHKGGIRFSYLCMNKGAVGLVERMIGSRFENKIDWKLLSANENAACILYRYQDKIDWYMASENKGLIELLERNQDKLDWSLLSNNRGIFRENKGDIFNELYNVRW